MDALSNTTAMSRNVCAKSNCMLGVECQPEAQILNFALSTDFLAWAVRVY